MFGQLGLAAMKAWKRAKSAPLSGLRRIAHPGDRLPGAQSIGVADPGSGQPSN
jgi:hypothetical protein